MFGSLIGVVWWTTQRSTTNLNSGKESSLMIFGF